MMKYKIIIALLMLLTSQTVSAEDYIDAVNRGNEALALGDYKTALESYQKAEIDLPHSPELSYNMGAALLGQQNYDEAVEEFTHALNSLEPGIAADSYYNLGNVNFQKGDYPAAIESYTSALNLNPDDMDAKYNLELARKMLKDNAQDEKQDGEEGQDGEQKEETDKPEDDQPESNEPESENDGDDESKQGEDGDTSKKDEDGDKSKKDEEEQKASDSTKAGQAAEAKKMSKEDAERILNALKNDEKEVQKKIKRAKSKNTYIGKDW